MDIFQKNIEALREKNPELATKLSKIDTNVNYEVFANGSFADANILDMRTNQFMYEKRPIDEIEAVYVELEKKYKFYKILYIYGIGNGYLINILLQNSFHEIIYVFEPDIELLYIALNLSDLSDAIRASRLVIVETEGFSNTTFRPILNGLAIIHFKAYMMELNAPFYGRYFEDIKHVNQEILKIFRYYAIATGNDANDELLGLKHFMQNIPLMLKNPTLKNLYKQGKNSDVAIIVATGPSLAKQLPLLKKIAPYVTIIAADASAPVLEKEQITPDIVTTLERTARTGEFYKECSKEFQKDILFALTAIVAKELIDEIKAGEFQFSMRPTGWHYSFMQFNDYGYVGYGMSAANMSYEIASEMGFKQIIIIGQDLAYGADGSSHSKNHIFGTEEIKQNKQDEYTLGYGGEKEVKTTKVWKMFLTDYENRVRINNETKDFITINATEGGARIRGTEEIPFAEAIERYVKQEKQKEKIVLEKPTQEQYEKNMHQAVERLELAIALGKEMQRKIKKVLKITTKIIRKYKRYDIEDIHKYAKYSETKKIVDKIAEVRTAYYKGDFRTFYESLISPLITHLEYDIAYWSMQSENSEKEKIHKNWKMIVFHHEWAYRINVNLDAIFAILEPTLESKFGVSFEDSEDNKKNLS